MRNTKLDQSQIMQTVFQESTSSLAVSLPSDTQISLSASDGDSVSVPNPVGYFTLILGMVGSTTWDSITPAYPTPTTETWTFVVGATTHVVTVTYTDSTKLQLSSLIKS